MFVGVALCDLGAKIEGLNMVPTEKLVRVADGTELEPNGVVFNV